MCGFVAGKEVLIEREGGREGGGREGGRRGEKRGGEGRKKMIHAELEKDCMKGLV